MHNKREMRRPIIKMFCGLVFFAAPWLAALAAAADAAAAVTVPTSTAPARVQPHRGALFKVAGAGHTLYLFGTIHVGAPDFFPLEPVVAGALQHAGALALEVDPNGDQTAAFNAVRKYGMRTDGSSAQAAIRPELRPRLDALIKQYGLTPAQVAPMKPWMLASVLAIGEFQEQGYKSELAVDSYLSAQAHQRGIPVLELESVASQLALLDSMTAPQQVQFLEDSINAIDDKTQGMQAQEIADAWRTADTKALDALAAELAADQTFSGQFMQHQLLEERNPHLADGIAGLLKRESNSVAAIGVMHLIGSGSVPQLLRQRGLKVERVY